jgi:hypothetical protein
MNLITGRVRVCMGSLITSRLDESMEKHLICDVCNTVIDPAEGKAISAEVFKGLMSNGFGIDNANIEMLTSSGMSRDEAIKSLSQMYATSTSDWLLCPKCALEAKAIMQKD